MEETEAILKLLRALDENPHMTQRQLSSHLGLSLGKINFLLKALVGKGLVKIENFKNQFLSIWFFLYIQNSVMFGILFDFIFLYRQIKNQRSNIKNRKSPIPNPG